MWPFAGSFIGEQEHDDKYYTQEIAHEALRIVAKGEKEDPPAESRLFI
jgi:hypothetical protein